MKTLKFVAPLFALAVLSACTKDYRQENGIAWNTSYHISYDSSESLSDSILRIFNEIDASLSPFNENSTVARINRNLTDSTDVMFEKVYGKSAIFYMRTHGAFDPTLGPVIRAWGFGEGHEVSADTARIDSLMKFVGLGTTKLDGHRLIKKDPRTEFNFSAIAKGFGVDCIAKMFIHNNVENFLVEVGGEIRVGGHNPHGKPWAIGIDRPDANASQGDIVSTLYLTEGSVATSGNYRNYHHAEGNTFGHTISPSNGRPVATDVISATVVTPASCADADALATICMVTGSEKALKLCNRMKVGVMLILNDMTVVTNETFDSLLDPRGPCSLPVPKSAI